jgi:glycine hydroxymethyltransferase
VQRDKQIFDLILEEQERQIHGLELLQRISQVMSNGSSWFCFDQKYAEGYPGKDTTEVVK